MTLPVSVENWLSISPWEMCLRSKFGKLSSSTRRNMGDKQNHKIMSILRHQYLRRIALRLFTKKCISYLGFVTVPPLEKESSGSASVFWNLLEIILPDFLCHCLSEDSCFETTSMIKKYFCQFSFQFCVTNVISFSCNKEPLMRKTELRARETFVNKITK